MSLRGFVVVAEDVGCGAASPGVRGAEGGCPSCPSGAGRGLLRRLAQGSVCHLEGLMEKRGRVRKQMGKEVICNACVLRNHMSGEEGGDFSEF